MARQSRDLMDELGAGLLPEPEFRRSWPLISVRLPSQAPQVITYGRTDDTALLARY
jgi:hypothetical protein